MFDDQNPWSRSLVSELLHECDITVFARGIDYFEPPSYFRYSKDIILPMLNLCYLDSSFERFYLGHVRFIDGIMAEMRLEVNEDSTPFINARNWFHQRDSSDMTLDKLKPVLDWSEVPYLFHLFTSRHVRMLNQLARINNDIEREYRRTCFPGEGQ